MKNILRSYLIRNNNGWGVFVLDCEHNTVFAHTDHGDYNYCWSAHGCKNLAHFLPNISIDYAMGKFTGKDYYKFDDIKTKKYLIQSVLEYRRDRTLDEKESREMFDSIINDEIEFHDENLFYNSLNDHYYFSKYMCEEMFIAEKTPDVHAVQFWENLWKPFIEELEKDEIYEWDDEYLDF